MVYFIRYIMGGFRSLHVLIRIPSTPYISERAILSYSLYSLIFGTIVKRSIQNHFWDNLV